MSIFHAAILKCPIKDVSEPRGFQAFIKWLANNALEWGSAPLVIPTAARLDGTAGTQYVLAHGILTGTARNGDVITFARAFTGVPVVVFGDGGLSYSSVIGALADQQRLLTTTALTATGFTMRAVVAAVATGVTARTVAFSSAANITTAAGSPAIDTATKVLATEAYDDNYTVTFEIVLKKSLGGGDDTDCDVTLEAKPSGGSYTTYWTASYTNTDTVNDLTVAAAPTILVDGLGASAVFRLTVTQTSGVSSRTTTLHGTTAYPSFAVTYNEATAGTEVSATPSGVSSISWIALGGT